MSRSNRTVTSHMLRRTARREQRHLERVQVDAAMGSVLARHELRDLGIGPETQLEVAKRDRRRFRWAVVAL